jgi:2-keto-4-pentenoate hydratase/2-oxohepta-3-ene-1,7-dioic acid hydratase in catechol pathway
MELIGRAQIGDTSCYGEIAGDHFHVIVGDLFAPVGSGGYRRNGQILDLDSLTLGAPIEGVRFINVMGGFKMAQSPPDLPPMWLPKATNYPSGDGSEIQVPSILTGPVQIESELAVVVGQFLRKASPDESRDAIFGWTVFNDITAPEYGAMGFWAVGKSIDGFTSWGPWIRRDLTEDRVMEGLAITATVNGQEVQRGNTNLYRFPPSEVISHVSHRISLNPGDVIALGTPFPPAEVAVGDHSICEVEEVGTLNNYFVAEKPEAPPSQPPPRSATAEKGD